MPTRRLTPDLVRAVYAAHGHTEAACRVLQCSRQAVWSNLTLRQAAQDGASEWRARQPPTVVEHVRVPRDVADGLAGLAAEAGLERLDYAGRLLAAVDVLPEPMAAAEGGIAVHVRLPVADRDRLRATAGDGFAARARAALVAAVRNVRRWP